MKRILSILVTVLVFGTLVYAKSLIIIQPNGGEFFKGSPMTINWTKDFPAAGYNASRMLIMASHLDGDITTNDLIVEVDVNTGQYAWPKVGFAKTKELSAGSDYSILLYMKNDPSTSVRSSPFTIKATLSQLGPPVTSYSYNIVIYFPNDVITWHFGQPNLVLWSRKNIEQYDKVYFWVRRPDGTIASYDKISESIYNFNVSAVSHKYQSHRGNVKSQPVCRSD